MGRVTPFTLATGPEAGVTEAGPPSTGHAEVDALLPALSRFAELHRKGMLGPTDLAEWQRLATRAQELLDGGSP